jgi:hypothetical protein
MLSRLGADLLVDNRPPVPVTVPELEFLKKGPPVDEEPERKEIAARFAEHRIVAKGRDAWAAINKAESFEGWKAIGAALAVGKAHALKVTGANAAWGRNYSREFNLWVRQHGFERMPAPTRSVAVELHEHAEAITSWRDSLPERQRKRLGTPGEGTGRHRYAQGYSRMGEIRGPRRSPRTRGSLAAMATHSGRSYNSHRLRTATPRARVPPGQRRGRDKRRLPAVALGVWVLIPFKVANRRIFLAPH